MAEEFVDFMNGIKKKPLEERILELELVINKLIEITVKSTNEAEINYQNFRNEISILKNEMEKMRLKQVQKELVDLKQLPPPPVLPPDNKKIDSSLTRATIVGELKALFRKKKNTEGEINGRNRKRKV